MHTHTYIYFLSISSLLRDVAEAADLTSGFVHLPNVHSIYLHGPNLRRNTCITV